MHHLLHRLSNHHHDFLRPHRRHHLQLQEGPPFSTALTMPTSVASPLPSSASPSLSPPHLSMVTFPTGGTPSSSSPSSPPPSPPSRRVATDMHIPREPLPVGRELSLLQVEEEAREAWVKKVTRVPTIISNIVDIPTYEHSSRKYG